MVLHRYCSCHWKHTQTKSDEGKEKNRPPALYKPPALLWLKFGAVAPSCGDYGWTTPQPARYWNKSKCHYELYTCYFYHCYYNPHLMSFHTLPLTFDWMGFYMTWVLYGYDYVWNDKRPNSGLVIWAYLESYCWATLILANLRYTGTSIYLHIFIFTPFFTVHMVSVDVNADECCQRWGTSEKKWRCE